MTDSDLSVSLGIQGSDLIGSHEAAIASTSAAKIAVNRRFTSIGSAKGSPVHAVSVGIVDSSELTGSTAFGRTGH